MQLLFDSPETGKKINCKRGKVNDIETKTHFLVCGIDSIVAGNLCSVRTEIVTTQDNRTVDIPGIFGFSKLLLITCYEYNS